MKAVVAVQSGGGAGPESVAGEIVRFRRVTRRFGARMALLDASCSLGAGVVGLVGPNGAGKTTWLRLAAGLIQPTTGEVRWRGDLPRRHPALDNRIALCTDRDALPPDASAWQLLRDHMRIAGLSEAAAGERAEASLHRLGLQDRMERPLGQLSRGQRQRVKLALTFALPGDLYLLDEPQNALDPVWRLEVAALVRAARDAGALVVVSSHILEEVEAIADRLVVLYRSRIVAMGPKDAVRLQLGRAGVALRVEASDARALGRALIGHPAVMRLEVVEGALRVAGDDLPAIQRGLAAAVLTSGVRVSAVETEGDDLTSVFRALGQEVR